MISLIIPHWELPGTRDTLKQLLLSVQDEEDLEIVLQINEGIGFGASVNEGLKEATGDYLIVANNDTQLMEGSLSDLCLNDAISVPKLLPEHRDSNPRAFYCIPRWVYDRLIAVDGYWYDEQFEMGYWEDDDLIKRLEREHISIKSVDSVVVYHLSGGGLTMHQLDRDFYFNANQKRYDEKWSQQ